jgi:uncharacterized membrane protein (UPF0127 family)
MAVSDLFHKPGWQRTRAAVGLVALAVGVLGCDAVGAESVGTSGDLDAQAPRAVVTTLPPAGYAWVIFGADTVVAEVASTPEERADGLMYRDEVTDGTGMIFVFPDSKPRSFWMANTYVALDIAYMDPSYRIVDIIAMEPLITDSYPSNAPAMFGLEVRQGWFAEHDIEIGAAAQIVFGVQG